MEYPHLQALYDKYKDQGFKVVSISIEPKDDAEVLRAYAASKGATFPILPDPTGEVSTQYVGTKGIPFNVLIDMNGNVVHEMEGYGEEAFKTDIEAKVPGLLKAKS